MESVDCVLCETDDARPYRSENGYESVQCNRCGLVYVSPRPTMDEMKALYQGQETKVDLYAHIASRDLKTIQARRCLGFIRPYKSSGRLLEVGSAAGYFLAEAKRVGFEVQGLDVTPQFVEFSSRALGVPAFAGTLEEAPFEEHSFDVIYMRNVLSHLAYPRREYEQLRRLLRPDGVLVFETGNVAELAPERAGELELPDHLYHFSESTIRTLCERSGFRCEVVHRFGLVSLWPIVQAVVYSRRSAPSHAERVQRPLPREVPPSRWTSRVAARAAQIVRYDLGRVVPGRRSRCTLVVVARVA